MSTRRRSEAQRERQRAAIRARYAILRRSGLCVKCAVFPAKPRRTRCPDCLELERRRTEARARGIRAHGLLLYAGHCPSCYLAKTRGKPICEWCAAIQARRTAARGERSNHEAEGETGLGARDGRR